MKNHPFLQDFFCNFEIIVKDGLSSDNEVSGKREDWLTVGLSVFSWDSFVALVVARVQSRLQLPGLTAGLSVRQELEQRDHAGPEVERDTRLQ